MSTAWSPAPDPLTSTNVVRFMAEHGFSSLDELRHRSIDDPEWFWDAIVQFLGIRFSTPYQRVLDTSRGPEWATWFTGGALNLADVCVDRWAEETPNRTAILWEGEDGEVRQWTYEELQAEVDSLAFMLAGRGIGEGDAVGIYLPMLPETVAALLALAKLGAVFLPLFSGYAASAVATRLQDAEAVALITADGFYRRGAVVDMWQAADDAASQVESVHTVVVVPRLGSEVEPGGGRNIPWSDPLGHEHYPTRAVDSEHTLFIAYTSG